LKKAENGDTLDVFMEVNGQGITRDRTEERHNAKTPLRITSKRD
jgi:hypothetical protein